MAGYAQNINTFTDYGVAQQDIERKRRMAELLQQQSMQPIEQKEGVPISWTQGLAKLLQGYNAGQGMRSATEEQKALAARRNQAMAETLGAMPSAKQMPMEGSQADVDQYGMAPQTELTQPTMQDNTAWLGKLAQIGPEATAIGGTMLGMQQKAGEADESRKFRTQQAAEARQATIQQLEMRLADQRISAQERAEIQRQLSQERMQMQLVLAAMQQQGRMDLAQFAVANRPPVQQPQPQIVQTESGPMQVDRSGRAQPIIGPDGRPVTPKSTEKALPTSAAQKLMENQQNLRRAEQALSLITGADPSGDKNATGWKGYVPDFALQRLDPEGVKTRAAISDIGSLVIHDRSGAAVTASEFPRLRPFIPRAEDDPKTAKTKLERFVQEYKAVVDEASDFYRSSGYRVPVETLRGAGGAPRGGGGAPNGVDPAVWAVMTQEERDLWKK
jgi:hypothetical protein